jgi:hypothetical protein
MISLCIVRTGQGSAVSGQGCVEVAWCAERQGWFKVVVTDGQRDNSCEGDSSA